MPGDNRHGDPQARPGAGIEDRLLVVAEMLRMVQFDRGNPGRLATLPIASGTGILTPACNRKEFNRVANRFSWLFKRFCSSIVATPTRDLLTPPNPVAY